MRRLSPEKKWTRLSEADANQLRVLTVHMMKRRYPGESKQHQNLRPCVSAKRPEQYHAPTEAISGSNYHSLLAQSTHAFIGYKIRNRDLDSSRQFVTVVYLTRPISSAKAATLFHSATDAGTMVVVRCECNKTAPM